MFPAVKLRWNESRKEVRLSVSLLFPSSLLLHTSHASPTSGHSLRLGAVRHQWPRACLLLLPTHRGALSRTTLFSCYVHMQQCLCVDRSQTILAHLWCFTEDVPAWYIDRSRTVCCDLIGWFAQHLFALEGREDLLGRVCEAAATYIGIDLKCA